MGGRMLFLEGLERTGGPPVRARQICIELLVERCFLAFANSSIEMLAIRETHGPLPR